MASTRPKLKNTATHWRYKIAKTNIYPTSLAALNERITALQPLWRHGFAGVLPVTQASCSPLYLCVDVDEDRAAEQLNGSRDQYTPFTSPVAEEVAAAVVRATAQTLSRLHAQGVVHGHVCLGVVHHHVADTRRVVLLEAELPMSAMVPQGALGVEARRCAAPEIHRGRPYAAAADVWGLAVLLLQLLAGPTRWIASGSPTMTADMVNSDLLSPFLSALSPHAASFVLPCLKDDPADRPLLGSLLQHPFLTASFAVKSNLIRRSSDAVSGTEEESDEEQVCEDSS